MAGNIPPLVSSTPPPLNDFDDDDDEEEEDEFGLYNTAEEVDYNECISFKEKDEEKQNVCKSRGEQDSTSQDSATDSGLCPDSEGVSPTPHSDDERTLKPNSCDKQAVSCDSEHGDCRGTVTENLETVLSLNLPNGHAEENHYSLETDNDFGDFEFAPSERIQILPEEVDNSPGSKSTSDIEQHTEVLHNGHNAASIQSHSGQITKEIEGVESNSSGFNYFESNSNGMEIKITEFASICTEKEESCKYEQSNTQIDESNVEKLDIASSDDSSSFNSVDISLEPKVAISSECIKIQNYDLNSTEKVEKDVEESLKSTDELGCGREGEEIEIPVENGDDDEFDDFTDFKADFSSCYESSKSEQGDKFNEHSKISMSQTKLEEAVSLPQSCQEESDDEFSNFADFSSSDCAFVSAQSSNSLDSHIPLRLDDSDLRTESDFQDWVSAFPCEDSEAPLAASALLRQDDIVWSRLFPLESSPALSYQWNESLSNRRLLTALNIDSRNILFTPWSTSAVPRFAANLSCGPLEPTKAAEPMQPVAPPPSIAITTVTSSATVPSSQESVPDAHFDWVGSGLTNPLDSCHSSLLDLNFIVTIETQLSISPKTVLNLPKTLTAGAEKILSSLPDISFMRKTYIDFPINEA